jgi:hypothetical protein
MEALGAVVKEIQRGERIGLVAHQPEKAGAGQAWAFLVAGVPKVFHPEQVGSVGCRQPELVPAPGAAPGEQHRIPLQLCEPGRDDIVKSVKKYPAHDRMKIQ